MTFQSKGKIFLADQRGYTESDQHRSFNTFNFGNYFNDHKHPFAELNVLNDETLAGGYSIKMTITENTCILLLPIVGAVAFKTSNGNEGLANAGEVQLLFAGNNETIELSNPYEDALINFLQIWMKVPPTIKNNTDSLFHFDPDTNKNQLLILTATEQQAIYPIITIGKFTGRKEAVYKTHHPQNSLFVFVIEGAFEVHGRLMHPRDGLGLWDNSGDIELEALSNDAIILLIEMDYRLN